MKRNFVKNKLTTLTTLGLLMLLLAALPVAAAPSNTITVNTLADELNADGDCSLREAVEAANTSAAVDACPAGVAPITISVPVGTVNLTLGELAVTADVAFAGGPSTIDGTSASRIFSFAAGSTSSIAGLTLQNGAATSTGATDGGGAILNAGNLTITDSRLTANSVTGPGASGGAIMNNLGTLTINDTQIDNNSSVRAGGGIETNVGIVNLTNVTFTTNATASTPGNGGALHISGAGMVDVTGGTVSGNTASAEGGGFWNASGVMTIDSTSFSDNVASGTDGAQGGGALFNIGGTLDISNATFTRNSADGASNSSGGGLLVDGGIVTIDNSTFTSNSATRAGGAIELDARNGAADLTVTNTDFTENSTGAAPGNGGAIHISGGGTADITAGIVSSNTAVREGGGFWNGSSTMRIEGTTFSNNSAAGNDAHDGGGALFNQGGSLTIINAPITGNAATGTFGSGGGIFNNLGTVSVTNSVIQNNTANRAGGGIENNAVPQDSKLNAGGSTTVTLDNVDFISNSTASNPGNGGALHVSGAGDTTVTGGTVMSNTASAEGGGFWNASGVMSISGTAFDGNVASGTAASQGGGALFNIGGTLNVSNATISNNSADGASNSSGGGLLVDGGTVTIADSTFVGNSATRAGGGIELDARNGAAALTITGTDFTSNSTGATPGNGGAIHISGGGTANITGGTVSMNSAAREGGGFWNGSATMSVDGTSFTQNEAQGAAVDDGGGALFNNGGVLSVVNATISGNSAMGASGSGGGIFNLGGTTIVMSSTISSNTAVRAGGGIEDAPAPAPVRASENGAGGTDLTLVNVTFDSNSAGSNPGNGGAVHVSGSDRTLSSTGGMVTNNSAAREGGGYWSGASMTIDGTSFMGNDAQGAAADDGGGAIFVNTGGSTTVSNASITGNTATGASGSGGGIFNLAGTLDVTSSTLSGNTANRAGGGVEANAGTTTLTNVTLASNNAGTAPGNGGGLHISGAGVATVLQSTVDSNIAVEGGGLWNSAAGTLTVDQSAIYGNESTGTAANDNGGGGIFNDGALIVVNSTVSGNTAAAHGGGVFNTTTGTTSVINATIYNNTLSGIENLSTAAPVSLSNSIVAHVAVAPSTDCIGLVTATNPNLDADGSCGASATGMPLLGPLTDNGGTTLSHLPDENSPAVDAGDNTVCAAAPINNIDQRDAARPFGDTCDLGSVERRLTTAVSLLGNSSDTYSATTIVMMIVLTATLFTGIMVARSKRHSVDG